MYACIDRVNLSHGDKKYRQGGTRMIREEQKRGKDETVNAW